jgi:hypothetical protein
MRVGMPDTEALVIPEQHITIHESEAFTISQREATRKHVIPVDVIKLAVF